ncbi:hypothetical protein D9M71_53320 [compost metagenome]
MQALDGLGANQYGTHGNEQCLSHAGQGLGLAVAETVIVIGRAQGIVHRQQVDERGDAIEHRIGQPRQQAD